MTQVHPKMLEAYQILIGLRDNPPKGTDALHGICQHFDHLPDAHYDFVTDYLMMRWPECSGDELYPVPGYDGLDAERAYDHTTPKDMWNPDHSYGAARFRLLNWLIEQLEAGVHWGD